MGTGNSETTQTLWWPHFTTGTTNQQLESPPFEGQSRQVKRYKPKNFRAEMTLQGTQLVQMANESGP